MIPKIIHYCWLSDDPYPPLIERCMESWRKNLSDYEFVKWDFRKIEKTKFKWVSDAYDHKRYAFAADYLRAYAVYNYGGIYLDTDVEVIKPFDDLLDAPYFLCSEYKKQQIEAATFGAEKGFPLLGKILEYYNQSSFIKEDGSFNEIVMPKIFSEIIESNYKTQLITLPTETKRDSSNIYILSWDYFSPKSAGTGKIEKTSNTYSVHHFGATWLPWYVHTERKFWQMFGMRNKGLTRRFLRILNKIVKFDPTL